MGGAVKRRTVQVRCHVCGRTFLATRRWPSFGDVVVPRHQRYKGVRSGCDGAGVQTLADDVPSPTGPIEVPQKERR